MPRGTKNTQETQSVNKTNESSSAGSDNQASSSKTKQPHAKNTLTSAELQGQGKEILDPDTVNGAEMTMT